METRRRMRTASALLALSVALTVLPGASRADTGEEPDLQVEVVGLKPGSRRDVVVRVTNVSDWWSDVTKMTVETVSPNPGRMRTFDVPDLNTMAETMADASLPHQFEFTYTLAADCDGHVVKADLSAGSNYEGVEEINLDNNVDEREVCPKQSGPATKPEPKPSPSGGVPKTSPSPVPSGTNLPEIPGYEGVVRVERGPGGASVATKPEIVGPDVPEIVNPGLPEVVGPVAPKILIEPDSLATSFGPALAQLPTRPGTHTVRLGWNAALARGSKKDFRGGSVSCYTIGTATVEPKHKVGWSQYEWFGSPCAADTWQAAVEFDPAEFRQMSGMIIDRAVLTFDEVESPYPFCTHVYPGYEDPDVALRCWRSGGGGFEQKPDGCVVVKVPAVAWRGGAPRPLPVITDPRSPAPTRVAPREWDVTNAFRWQVDPSARGLIPPGVTPPPIGSGFLLTGALDLNGLSGEDSTACVSQITNIKLRVTYTVVPEGPPPIVR